MAFAETLAQQWQLRKDGRETLSACHPEEIQTRLHLEPQFVVIHLGHADVQLPLITFTREVLELEPVAQSKALAKIRRMEQSFLSPLSNPSPA